MLVLIFRREIKPAFLFYKVWSEQDHTAVASLKRVVVKLWLLVPGQQVH